MNDALYRASALGPRRGELSLGLGVDKTQASLALEYRHRWNEYAFGFASAEAYKRWADATLNYQATLGVGVKW